MATITIAAMVEGGKATAGPPLGPSLAPTGVNIGQVIAKINEKTKDFAGMQVPIKVIVDKAKKAFEVEVGTPPVSALIKAELGLKEPVKEEAGKKGKPGIGNLTLDQALKIAKKKKDAMLSRTVKAQIKEIAGTCVSLGAQVEGKSAKEFLAEVEQGKYDDKLKD